MTVMDRDAAQWPNVEVLTEDDVRRAIANTLAELGLTASEVRLQAARQDFSSPLAHKLWIAYGDLL